MQSPYETWTEYQEQRGERVQMRIEEILTLQGKRSNYTIEDVQRAAAQAESEVR